MTLFALFDEKCLHPISNQLLSISFHFSEKTKKICLNIPWPISTEKQRKSWIYKLADPSLLVDVGCNASRKPSLAEATLAINCTHLYLCIWLHFTCIQLCMFPYGYISYVNICKIASSCVFADVHSHMYICKNTYACNVSVHCMHMCTLTNIHIFVCLLVVYYICLHTYKFVKLHLVVCSQSKHLTKSSGGVFVCSGINLSHLSCLSSPSMLDDHSLAV